MFAARLSPAPCVATPNYVGVARAPAMLMRSQSK